MHVWRLEHLLTPALTIGGSTLTGGGDCDHRIVDFDGADGASAGLRGSGLTAAPRDF